MYKQKMNLFIAFMEGSVQIQTGSLFTYSDLPSPQIPFKAKTVMNSLKFQFEKLV